jgi:DNA polymerase
MLDNMANASALTTLHGQISICRKCPLCVTRNAAVPGEGPVGAPLMFVGEAPGHVNDKEGRPFVGRGGAIFNSILGKVGIQRRDVFITNAVKCWPPGNRRPTIEELRICDPYLKEQIALVRPILIIAMGTTAFVQLTGRTIKMREEHGVLDRSGAIPVCAVFHPNGIRYVKGGASALVIDIKKALSACNIVHDGGTGGGQMTFPVA